MTQEKWHKPRTAECIGQCPNCGDFKYRDLDTGEIFYADDNVNYKKQCSCKKGSLVEILANLTPMTNQELLTVSTEENWEFQAGIEIPHIPQENLLVRQATDEECVTFGFEPQPGYVLILHPETHTSVSLYFRPNPRTSRLINWAKSQRKVG